VLHKAIKSLVQTINIPELSEAPRREVSPAPRSGADKRMVIEYSALTGPGKWLNKDDHDEKQGPHKRPWRGDQQEVMWKGQYNKAQHVIDRRMELLLQRGLINVVGLSPKTYASSSWRKHTAECAHKITMH
jgi:hypothetical protein